MGYKYYNYGDIEEDITTIPISSHFFFELDIDYFYFVDSTQLKLYLFQISIGTETEIDVDPGDLSVNGKDRLRPIRSAWHDRANSIIYFVDCIDDFFYVWKLDYSVSKTTPTVTEVGTSIGQEPNLTTVWDIFKIGATIYVINIESRVPLGDPIYVVWDVTSPPFINIVEDSLSKQVLYHPYFGVVIGTDFIVMCAKSSGADRIYPITFDSVTPALTQESGYTEYDRPSSIDLHGSSYDGSDIIYIIAYDTLNSKNLLVGYSVSGDSWTMLGIHDISMMLDRNTDSTAIPPFNLEKGFHITEDKIYQIPKNYSGRLNLISVFIFTDTIIAITDHFVIDDSGNIYEMIDYIANDYFMYLFLDYWKEDYPTLEMEFRRDKFAVSKNLFMQIIGNLTASYTNRIFKGTYNFKDDADGAEPEGWTPDNGVNCTTTIISSWQGHRKVLQFYDNNVAGLADIYCSLGGDRTYGSIEVYMGLPDVSNPLEFRLQHGATIINRFRIFNDKFQEYSGGAYNDIAGPTPLDNTPHHIRFDFECTAGAYDGLAQYDYHLYIDGVYYGDYDFLSNEAHVDQIRFLTGWADGTEPFYGYIDAFAYSFDVNYNVGDNRYVEEGEPNKVVFEGVINDFDGHKIQKAFVVNKGGGMDEVEPSGEFTVDTDGLISAIISGFHDYITEGTLQDGADLGTIFLKGDKKSRKIFNQMKDFDGYTWGLQPQGVLDYDDGSVDSGVDLQYDGTHIDHIWDVDTIRISTGTNRVIVKGSINLITGNLYEDQWNDVADQLEYGIHKIVIIDANLNSNVKCLAKATAIGTREMGLYLTVQGKFRKPTLGVIYPHQTLIFKYISEDVSISEAEYIIDGIGIDLLSEEIYLQASAGLIFEYEAIEKELPEENSQRIEQVATSLGIKTGFNIAHEAGVVLSFVNGTRTFTITPEGSTFEYWIKGVKYTKTEAESVIINDTEGLWYIYYVGNVLTASQVEWIIKDGDKALVSIIYWNAGSNIHLYLAYEVHSFDMSPADHSYLHRTIGTNFVSGLALVEGAGGDDGKVAMDSGECRDEDIHIDITDGAGTGLFEQELGNTTVFAAAQIPVYHRWGPSAWRKYNAWDYPFYNAVGGHNVHYNSYSAPNWTSVEATNAAKYIAYWIFATNNIHEPIISIMGQLESSTLNAAKEDNTLEGLSFGTLPFEEMKILYRLIFKSDSTHAHTLDMRSVANVPGGTYVPQPSEVSDEVYGATWDGVTTIAPSKNVVYDKIETLGGVIEANLGIGIENKRWKNCFLEGSFDFSRIKVYQAAYTNVDTNDAMMEFGIPLDYIIGGTHNLVITQIKIGLYDADVDDYINNIKIYAWTDFATRNNPLSNATNYNTPQLITWDFADLTLGGVYERISIHIEMFNTGLEHCDIGFVQVEYYYT